MQFKLFSSNGNLLLSDKLHIDGTKLLNVILKTECILEEVSQTYKKRTGKNIPIDSVLTYQQPVLVL